MISRRLCHCAAICKPLVFCDNVNDGEPNEAVGPQEQQRFGSCVPDFRTPFSVSNRAVMEFRMFPWLHSRTGVRGLEVSGGVYLFFLLLLLLLFTGNGLNNSWQPSATKLFKRTNGGEHRAYKDGLITITKTRNDNRHVKHSLLPQQIQLKNPFKHKTIFSQMLK